MENSNLPLYDWDTGTFFLEYYTPKWKWKEYNGNNERIINSQNILDYKNNCDDKIWANYTVELMNALAYIAEKRFESLSAVYMVAVPCSKPWIESTMKRSIHRIAALSSDGAVELFTKCSIPFIDAADLIIRTDPVDTSHFIGTGGERPGYKEHLASMMIQGRKAD